MPTPAAFLTRSLRQHPHGQAVTRILAAAIEAVRRHVTRDGDTLTVADQTYHMLDYERIFILSIGKAGLGMAAALSDILRPNLTGGLVVTKHPTDEILGLLSVMEGGHPVPTASSLAAGTKVLELAASLTPRDLLFCLISGGGSALVTVPVEGVSLADIQKLTSALLACGARIDEINTLRRELDRVKGGGLARAANGATIVSLILSDVVGNPLEAIASGPTVPSPTTSEDAPEIIEKYGIQEQIPASVLGALRLPSSLQTDFKNVQNVLVGSNLIAAQAALAQAETEGFNPYLLRTDLQGEARDVAFELANTLRWAALHNDPVHRPACIIAGGETTVTLSENPGRGGRNTELALAAVTELAEFPHVMLVTLATDGEDGPTDAAGAVVTGEMHRQAHRQGLDPQAFLQRNDSYTFFSQLDDLLKPGPTGTNVNDLVFLFVR